MGREGLGKRGVENSEDELEPDFEEVLEAIPLVLVVNDNDDAGSANHEDRALGRQFMHSLVRVVGSYVGRGNRKQIVSLLVARAMARVEQPARVFVTGWGFYTSQKTVHAFGTRRLTIHNMLPSLS
jgi:hypothetical protein